MQRIRNPTMSNLLTVLTMETTMSLKFRVIKRKMSLGKHAGKKVQVAGVITRGKVTFANFCKEVSDGSTLTSADVKAVVDRMIHVIRHNVGQGRSVEIEELGIFRPLFRCRPVAEGEEFRALTAVYAPRIGFRAKKAFRTLTDVALERISEAEEAARTAIAAKRRQSGRNAGGGTPNGQGGGGTPGGSGSENGGSHGGF